VAAIPSWWYPNENSHENKKTRTKLLNLRKEKRKPDKSFDIDGDGAVSHRDFFFANMFDQGKKGYLTKREMEECRKTLEDGNFEDNYEFGLENKMIYPDSKD